VNYDRAVHEVNATAFLCLYGRQSLSKARCVPKICSES